MKYHLWRSKGTNLATGLLLGILTHTAVATLTSDPSKTSSPSTTSYDATHVNTVAKYNEGVGESIEDTAIAELPEEEFLVTATVASREDASNTPSTSQDQWHLQPFSSGEAFLEQALHSGALSGGDGSESFRRFQIALFQLPKVQLIELITLSGQSNDQRLFNTRYLLADALNEKLSFEEAFTTSQTLLNQGGDDTPQSPNDSLQQGRALLETAFQKHVSNDTYAALDWFAQTLLMNEDNELPQVNARRLSQVMLNQLQALGDQPSIDWVLSLAQGEDRKVMMDILGHSSENL